LNSPSDSPVFVPPVQPAAIRESILIASGRRSRRNALVISTSEVLKTNVSAFLKMSLQRVREA
jgi:hypothetical protein